MQQHLERVFARVVLNSLCAIYDRQLKSQIARIYGTLATAVCAAVQFEIEPTDFARNNILIKCYRSSMAVVIHVRYNRNDSGL